MKKICTNSLLFICLIFSAINCIEDCSEAVRFFKGYQCKTDDVYGEGSAGKVFIVSKDGKEYILKHQKQSTRSDAELKFLKRVRGLDYVIQLNENINDGDDVYTIINFGHKGSLLDLVIEGEISDDIIQLMKMFRKIVEGVVEIHKRGIVHADLKLENIVVDENNDPYIIDFDLAVDMGVEERGRGSLNYTSPEVLDAMYTHKKVLFDKKIDTYSLGVILYAMITQGFPFEIKPGAGNLSYALKNSPVVFEEGFNRQIMEIILDCIQERQYRIDSDELLDKVTKFLLKPSSKSLIKDETYTINELTSLKLIEGDNMEIDSNIINIDEKFFEKQLNKSARVFSSGICLMILTMFFMIDF
jgi:serine/threonine protein kinase